MYGTVQQPGTYIEHTVTRSVFIRTKDHIFFFTSSLRNSKNKTIHTKHSFLHRFKLKPEDILNTLVTSSYLINLDNEMLSRNKTQPIIINTKILLKISQFGIKIIIDVIFVHNVNNNVIS